MSTIMPLDSSARASNIKLEPSLAETGTWDSNPLMLRDNAKALYGSSTTPRLVLTDKAPACEASADLSASYNVFNQSSFDSTDLHGKFGLLLENERWGMDVRQQTDYDTTRTSEITYFGSNVGSVRHLGLSLAPQISFKPTPVDILALAGTASASRYESALFTNYYIFSASPSWTHSFTPRHAGFLLGKAQRFQTARSPKAKVDSVGPSVGWSAKLSPYLIAKVSAGTQASQQKKTDGTTTPWTWDYTFTSDVTYKDEQNSVSFQATRAQQPYGNGTERLLTTFSVTGKRAINENLSVNALVSYQFAENPDSAGTQLKSVIRASGGVAYKAMENVEISSSYQFKNEALTNEDETAKGSLFTVGLVYRPGREIEPW